MNDLEIWNTISEKLKRVRKASIGNNNDYKVG